MTAKTSPIAVLVGEDEPAIRRLIRSMLESSRFIVFEADCASSGLAILHDHPEIQLAILDMVMPGMSGLDLAAEMSRRHCATKILYMTGYVDSIAIQAIADNHPEAVLLKPFTEQELIARVRKLLNLTDTANDAIEVVERNVRTGWDRLIEGSDTVHHPYRIASYRNTIAAYSIAAAHAAVLREANIVYQFAPLYGATSSVMSFQLVTAAEQWRAALDCISAVGLSADIAVAA